MISVRMLCVTLGPLLWLGAASAQTCPDRPPGEPGLLMKRTIVQGQKTFEAIAQATELHFGPQKWEFCFGVLRTSGEEEPRGALAVKVVRVYSKDNTATSGDAKRVYLYRGGALSSGDYQSTIFRHIYDLYHRDEVVNFRLSREFHIQQGGFASNEPIAVREKFLYRLSPDVPHDKMTQRTYLLPYAGVPATGLWVPFQVSVDAPFDQVRIWVFDVGDAGTGPVEYDWVIKRKP